MTANPWRGEVSLLLDGRSYVLRPTFEALQRIEQELSTGFVALSRKLAEGSITLAELAVIVERCIPPDTQDGFVREAMLRGGLSGVIESVASMVAAVLGGFDGIGDSE